MFFIFGRFNSLESQGVKRFFVARRMDMRGCLRRMPCFIGV
nr:MAG TPA: hypothetical protein [Caudoviricetes sp.]